MSDDAHWIERAQSAEAKLATLQTSIDAMKDNIRNTCDTLGAKVKADGTIDIDFDAFVEKLGADNALQVRAIIDEKYGISGAPGEKPRMRVKAA